MLSNLNKQQKDVILNSLERDSLTLAGAGSGKTRVLITRIQYIIKELSTNPSSIMAITFTRKAANELKDRLNTVATKEELGNLWVGTYHSICIKIIDMFGESVGIKEGFTIIDSQNARKSASEIMLNLGIEASKSNVKSYLKRVSNLKNNLIFPKKFRENVLTKYAGDVNELSSDSDYVFADFYSRYQSQNVKNNVMDFDDLILYTVLILSSNVEAQSFIRKRFKYILADEVQDSNPSNIVLLNLFSKRCNLFMVGDTDQAIYGFRGARPDLVTNYCKKEKMAIFKLEQNYRSTRSIVEASNALISQNTGRMEKECFSNNPMGDKIQLNISDTNYDEANYIAKRVLEHKRNGGKYEDVLILYRTNAQSRVLEEEFMKQGIPYSLVGALSFNERAEIKDCMSALKLSCNLRDKYSLKRVLSTLDGIGKKTIDDLMLLMDEKNDAIDVLNEYRAKSQKARESIEFLLGILTLINRKPTAVMNKIADYYITRLRTVNDEKALDRIENIKELKSVVLEKETAGMALQEFVMQMDLMSANDNMADADTVTMMTIHASKGLESKVVFIVGVNNGILPHDNCYQNKNGEQEERRLMYVGMTRAEEKLFISRYNEDSRNVYEESTFIQEIPIRFLEYDDILF